MRISPKIGADATEPLGSQIKFKYAPFLISGIDVISFIKLVSLAAVTSLIVMFASGLTRTIAQSPPFALLNVILSTLLTPVSPLCRGRNLPYVPVVFHECIKEAMFVAVLVLTRPVLLHDTPELFV